MPTVNGRRGNDMWKIERLNGPVSRRRRESYCSQLPLAGRRVAQAAARGDTVLLYRRRPVGVRGLPVVLGRAGGRRQNG